MRFLGFNILISSFAATLAAQSPQPKMGAPLSGLTSLQLQRFDDGKADFANVFDEAQGLGPIFNQISCANCHNNPVGGPGSSTITRFGYDDGKGGFDPLTAIGGTLLQAGAIDPAVQEVIPAIANVIASRVTPSALGAGLIEAIDDVDIVANEFLAFVLLLFLTRDMVDLVADNFSRSSCSTNSKAKTARLPPPPRRRRRRRCWHWSSSYPHPPQQQQCAWHR